MYAQDDGCLLNKGRAYGDTSRRSKDAIAVPLIERHGNQTQVLGILSIQSYESQSYWEADVKAFQWIADSMTTALLRKREDEQRCLPLLGDEDLPALPPSPLAALIDGICERLKAIRNRVEAVAQIVPLDNPQLSEAVDALRRECEKNQTDIIELLLRSLLGRDGSLPVLTGKQQEVLDLMVLGLSNKEIAGRLFVTEQTVKTHVSAIISRFDVSGRSGVIEIVKRVRS